MTICYKILDLPSIPDEYIDVALDRAKTHQGQIQSGHPGDVYTYNREVQKDGKKIISRNNARFGLEDIMSKWVTNNISNEWSLIGVATSILNQTVDHESYLQSPHTDSTRTYGLLYLLESSNSDQDTIFWQEPGYGIHRKRGVSPLNLDNLIKIDSIRIQPKTWVYIDTSILHSIENVQDSRIVIQVSFDIDPFNIFIK